MRSILLLGLLLLGACGGDAATTNRADAEAVFRSTLEAFGRGDLPALHGLLTRRGRASFMADLRAFRDGLALPEGAWITTRRALEARFPDDADRRVQAAQKGGPASVLALLVSLRPVTVPSEPRRERRPDGVQVFFYRDAQKVERPVRLIRDKIGWSVDRLEF